MTYEDAKDLVADLINQKTGIKGMELVADRDVRPVILAEHDLSEILDDLVAENRVLCVEYALPPDNSRIKGFYLPAGTQIRLSIKVDFENSEN